MNYAAYSIKPIREKPERKPKRALSRKRRGDCTYTHDQFSELTGIPPTIVRLLLDAERLPYVTDSTVTNGDKYRLIVYDASKWYDAARMWRSAMKQMQGTDYARNQRWIDGMAIKAEEANKRQEAFYHEMTGEKK